MKYTFKNKIIIMIMSEYRDYIMCLNLVILTKGYTQFVTSYTYQRWAQVLEYLCIQVVYMDLYFSCC